jgi:SAM-dependent methyltransferase
MNDAFDEYADNYDAALARGVSVSGEDKEFFARGRIAWLASCLEHMGAHTRSVLDFGCGTGAAAPLFLELLEVDSVIGVDTSIKSIETATKAYGRPQVRFFPTSEYSLGGQIDMAFCNGVFHHIPRAERAAAVEYVRGALAAGGLFAFWENNPWNPGTRYVMSRIPFDRDAVTLSAIESRRLLRLGGFEILRTDFLFVFPRVLGALRLIEPYISRLPMGAQYQVLCRKA